MRPDAERNPAKGLPPTPPPGTGNKTLADFSQEYSIDLQQILKGLSDNNVSAGAAMTIKQIARQNDMVPSDVYALMLQIAKPHEDQ